MRLKPRRQTEANKINPAHDRRLAAVSRHAITSSLTMVLANPIDLTPIGVEHASDHPDRPPLTPRPRPLKISPVALKRATGCRAPKASKTAAPAAVFLMTYTTVASSSMAGRGGETVRSAGCLPPVLYPCHAPVALNLTEGRVVFQPGEPP